MTRKLFVEREGISTHDSMSGMVSNEVALLISDSLLLLYLHCFLLLSDRVFDRVPLRTPPLHLLGEGGGYFVASCTVIGKAINVEA